MKASALVPAFVTYIPEALEPGKLYVSMEYAMAVHLCACGCGMEVTTPLSPTDWQMQFDGVSVSLSPSIGNWSFPCRSHYWIRNNEVRWSGSMTQTQIARGRSANKAAKASYYAGAPTIDPAEPTSPEPPAESASSHSSRWFRRWFR